MAVTVFRVVTACGLAEVVRTGTTTSFGMRYRLGLVDVWETTQRHPLYGRKSHTVATRRFTSTICWSIVQLLRFLLAGLVSRIRVSDRKLVHPWKHGTGKWRPSENQRCGGCNGVYRGVWSNRCCWLCIIELLMSSAWELLIAEIECLSLITARLYYATTTRWMIGRCDAEKRSRLQLNMAGRLEDEEYWHTSEAKAFNFEDDEVSRVYNIHYGC